MISVMISQMPPDPVPSRFLDWSSLDHHPQELLLTVPWT